MVYLMTFGVCLASSWLRKALRCTLPSPGEGPSEESRKSMFLRVHGYG